MNIAKVERRDGWRAGKIGPDHSINRDSYHKPITHASQQVRHKGGRHRPKRKEIDRYTLCMFALSKSISVILVILEHRPKCP